MSPASLPPLPKFFMGFEHTTDALAHCKRFGAHPLIEKRDDGLHWPISFASRELAREHIASNGIVQAYAMGLRTGSVERFAIGINNAPAPTAPRKAPVTSAETPADDASPVAKGTRVAGATFVCKALAAERPETLASKDLFVAECAKLGVIAATASTQWYRLRTK